MADGRREARNPAFEKARKYGIRNICVHKGLLPAIDYKGISTWRYAMVDDVAQAAKDWPDLNFVIYHAAFRPLLDASTAMDEYRETGRIPWVTELADIRESHDVSNVYAELGTTFASVCVTFPELAAAILGTCIKGLGADHVVWGTDSIWWGSPQWQIEALRRLEIPAEMQKRHSFAPLGPADGQVKNQILGHNLARLFHIDPRVQHGASRPKTSTASTRSRRSTSGTARSRAACCTAGSGRARTPPRDDVTCCPTVSCSPFTACSTRTVGRWASTARRRRWWERRRPSCAPVRTPAAATRTDCS